MSVQGSPLLLRPKTSTNFTRQYYSSYKPFSQQHSNPQKREPQNLQKQYLQNIHNIRQAFQESRKQLYCDDKEYQSLRKLNKYSRQNIHLVNKKNRQIRLCQMTPTVALINMHNDRIMLGFRSNSAQGNYVQEAEKTPVTVKSLKKINHIKNISNLNSQTTQVKIQTEYQTQKVVRNQTEFQQTILRSINGKSKKLGHRPITSKSQKTTISINKVQPPKVSSNGHILVNFQTHFKKKCIEDNLNVMANLVKRKIKNLDKKQTLIYLQKLMERNNIQK